MDSEMRYILSSRLAQKLNSAFPYLLPFLTFLSARSKVSKEQISEKTFLIDILTSRKALRISQYRYSRLVLNSIFLLSQRKQDPLPFCTGYKPLGL